MIDTLSFLHIGYCAYHICQNLLPSIALLPIFLDSTLSHSWSGQNLVDFLQFVIRIVALGSNIVCSGFTRNLVLHFYVVGIKGVINWSRLVIGIKSMINWIVNLWRLVSRRCFILLQVVLVDVLLVYAIHFGILLLYMDDSSIYCIFYC